MDKQRNSIYAIGELDIGDVFYFPNDKKKVSWIVTDKERSRVMANKRVRKDIYDTPYPNNRQVIFLRRA